MSAAPYAGWTPWAVGCHWSRDGFTASTYQHGAESGYLLVYAQRELGRFPTWSALEAAYHLYRQG